MRLVTCIFAIYISFVNQTLDLIVKKIGEVKRNDIIYIFRRLYNMVVLHNSVTFTCWSVMCNKLMGYRLWLGVTLVTSSYCGLSGI